MFQKLSNNGVMQETFTLEQKRDTSLKAERTSIQVVSLKYKVDRQNTRQWKCKFTAINEKIHTTT